MRKFKIYQVQEYMFDGFNEQKIYSHNFNPYLPIHYKSPNYDKSHIFFEYIYYI
jgi:hypothetical protein